MQASATINQIKLGNQTLHWLPASTQLSEAELSRDLHPSELALAGKFTATKRRLDFMRGRWLFHQVNENSSPLLSAEDGQPIWPNRMHGSLTHKLGHVLIAISSSHALGIDLESRQKVGLHLLEKIAKPDEFARINDDMHGDANLALASIFAAKEAIFKALYPLTGEFFYFHDFACLGYDADTQIISGLLQKKLGARFSSGTPFDIYLHGLESTAPQELVLAAAITPS